MKNILYSFLLIFTFFFSVNTYATDIKKWQTAEGMSVYYVASDALPIVDISLNFKVGSSYDPADKAGLANITQDLLSKANASYSEEMVNKTLADFGAELSASTNQDYTTYRLRLLNQQETINKITQMWMSLITEANFAEEIFSRQINRYIASYRESLTDISSVASRAFNQEVFANHPYGNLPDDTSYTNIRLGDLEEFYQKHYQAQNAVIVFVGALSADKALGIAEELSTKLFKNNNKYYPEKQIEIPISKSTQAKSVKVDFNSQQTHIYMGMPFIERHSPDFFPIYLGNYILGGGGFSSQLTQIIREDNGLAYSVFSSFNPLKNRGSFVINMQTENKNSEKAIELLNKTIKDFLANGVSDESLEKAKKFLVGSFPLRQDSNAKMIGLISMVAAYDLPLDYLNTWVDNINKVTKDDIRQAFARNFRPDEMITVVVGKGN